MENDPNPNPSLPKMENDPNPNPEIADDPNPNSEIADEHADVEERDEVEEHDDVVHADNVEEQLQNDVVHADNVEEELQDDVVHADNVEELLQEEIVNIRAAYELASRDEAIMTTCYSKGFKAPLRNIKKTKRRLEFTDGVVKFQMFSTAGIRRLLLKIEDFKSWSGHYGFKPAAPSALYEHGMILNYSHFHSIVNDWLNDYIQPIVNEYFDVANLDSHITFEAAFARNKHNKIALNHEDNSHITMKVCLENSGPGANWQLGGANCSAHPLTTYIMKEGEVLLHHGRHGNAVSPYEGRDKKYLIIWFKSSEYGAGAGAGAWCSQCEQREDEGAD